MANGDYYSTLGLEPEASPKQIKEAFRRLALRHHPDRNREDAQSAVRMKAINEAYAVLSNPRKRAEYDHLRRSFGSAAYGRFREAHSEQDIFRGSDVNQIFEEISRAFGFRGFEDVFRDHYGPGFRSFEFSKPGIFGKAFVFTSGPRPGAAAGGGPLGRMLRHGLKRLLRFEPPQRGADRRDSITLAPQLARSGEKSATSTARGSGN